MIKKSAFQEGGDISKIEKLNEKELKFKIHATTASSYANGEYSSEYGASADADAPKWPANGLTPIDLPETSIVIKSAENEIQKKRELSTLAVLVFKQFCPDSPSEPTDADSKSSIESITKIIPLEDITLNGQQQSSHSTNAQSDYNMSLENTDTEPSAETTQMDGIEDEEARTSRGGTEPKFYNPNHHKNDARTDSSNSSYRNYANNSGGENNRRGYYNQQHHQQQKRQQFQQQQQQQQQQKPANSSTTNSAASSNPVAAKQPLIATKPPLLTTPLSVSASKDSAQVSPSTPLSPKAETSSFSSNRFSELSSKISAATSVPKPVVAAKPALAVDLNVLSILQSGDAVNRLRQILNSVKPAPAQTNPESTATPASTPATPVAPSIDTFDLNKILSMAKARDSAATAAKTVAPPAEISPTSPDSSFSAAAVSSKSNASLG